MKKAVIDFETYYDSDLSVVSLGLTNYVQRSEAYIVSIVTDGIEFCGTMDQVREQGLDKLADDPDIIPVAANSNFDQAWWEKYFEPLKRPWECVLDMAAFHQYPRELAMVSKVVLKLPMDKSTRDEMKGVVFEELSDERQQQVMDYCLNDSLIEKQALETMGPMSPVEARLAAHTRLINRRGVHVDVDKISRDKRFLAEVEFNALKTLPWVEGGKAPLSYPAFADFCRMAGVNPPKSLDKRDLACQAWMNENPKLAPVLKAMRALRGTGTKLSKLTTIIENADEWNRIPLDMLYCGARHTRRWSSKNINVQNLDAKRAFEEEMRVLPYFVEHPEEQPGIFMREYFLPPPGKKFVILDYSQIEPRCLNWLVWNEEMLSAVRLGYGVYEAHARASMGWKGAPGTMKKEFPEQYKFAKMRVLALGYGMGAGLFRDKTKADINVELTELQAEAQVKNFRATNPKIVAKWREFDNMIRSVAQENKDRTLQIEMPTGDFLQHFNVRGKGRNKGFESYTIKGDHSQMSHQPKLWGGVLTENITQRMARDLLAEAILALEDAGLPVVFHAHDEVVLAVDADNAGDAFEHAKHIMEQAPAWCPDIPLGVDGAITDTYTKLA